MPLLMFRRAKNEVPKDELSLWQPCWRCGHQFPRDEKTCPVCGSRRGKHR